MYEATDQEPTGEQAGKLPDDSSVDDGTQVWAIYPSEQDHPFNQKDPRNQYVQHNNRFVEVEQQPRKYDFNHVRPYFKTTYKRTMSPPSKVAQRKQIVNTTIQGTNVTYGRHMDNYGHGKGPYKPTEDLIC